MKTVEERFWSKVKKGPKCWVWTGALTKNKKGYGRLNINGEYIVAHRVSYEIHYDSIPKGMEVCHTCDNPPCVRPEHLFLGTHADNMKDAGNKGRMARGSKSRQSKLTEVQVKAIRNDTRLQKEIAKEYNVAQSQISRVKRSETWKHVR